MSTLPYNTGGYGVGPYSSVPPRYFPVDHYLGLLTSLYKTAPNLNAWLQTLLEKLNDISLCVDSMLYAFTVGSAAGEQLDIVGIQFGAARLLPFVPTGGESALLDDRSYRKLIMAKLFAAHWNGQAGSIYAWWPTIFPNTTIVIVDNQNMTVDVEIGGLTDSLWQQMISNHMIVPETEAVLYTYTFGEFPVFGFDQNTAVQSGFDQGHFI